MDLWAQVSFGVMNWKHGKEGSLRTRSAATSTSIERGSTIVASVATLDNKQNLTHPILRPPRSYLLTTFTTASVEARCLVFNFKPSLPSRFTKALLLLPVVRTPSRNLAASVKRADFTNPKLLGVLTLGDRETMSTGRYVRGFCRIS